MRARVLMAVLAALVSFSPGLPASGPDANAFELPVHTEIVAAVFGDGREVSEYALESIWWGNMTTDLHQFSDELHFDNARSRQEICAKWQQGLNASFNRAVELSEPVGLLGDRLSDREGALEAYGRVTHTLADFYSHTNWIESWLERSPGIFPPTAPILSTICDPDAFPPDLVSGYFNLFYGIDGCPGTAFGGEPTPPEGYRYCHEQLAKDHRDEGHGAENVPFIGVTHHEVAVALATEATRDSWRALRDRIGSHWGRNPEIDADCVLRKLARGGDEACRRLGPGLDGYVRDTNGTPIAGATVTVGDRTAATDLGGHYGFLGLQSGGTTVTAAAPDYETRAVAVTLPVNGYAAQDIVLARRVQVQVGDIIGVVRNASNGQAIAGATLSAGGRSSTADASGRYRITEVAAGRVEVTASATGFMPDSETVTVSASGSVERTFALSQRVAAGQTRIVLTWGSTPRDLDSHLWVPSGTSRTEIYYSSRGNAAAAPFAALDVDDRDGSGPETTTVARLSAGTYTYAVYNYSNESGTSMASGGARVQLIRADGVAQTFNAPPGAGRWWTVFTMDGATGSITPVNRLGDRLPFVEPQRSTLVP